MPLTAPNVTVRRAGPDDAELVHGLYRAAPGYFEVISIPMPTLAEARTELAAAEGDERRRIELVLVEAPPAEADPEKDPVTGLWVGAYLDVTLDYLQPGDATVNLLLVRDDCQRCGIGTACMRDLEVRLNGRVKRLLASIYGQNPRAERFWRSLGYRFAIDAKPVLDWYAKDLAAGA